MPARQRADHYDRFQVSPAKMGDPRGDWMVEEWTELLDKVNQKRIGGKWKIRFRGSLADCKAYVDLEELGILND